jgi:hypothetical protein
MTNTNLFRCGARQAPSGCDTLTADQAPCGAYRCEPHMAEHLTLCEVR